MVAGYSGALVHSFYTVGSIELRFILCTPLKSDIHFRCLSEIRDVQTFPCSVQNSTQITKELADNIAGQ